MQSPLPQRTTEVPRLWDTDGIASFLVRLSEDFLTQAALRIVPEAPPASPGHMLAVGEPCPSVTAVDTATCLPGVGPLPPSVARWL